ncbi:PhzF family phenazine biosynthesis protein [Mammaliicoccus sciuri]|uniref:PhzF family phenazine biosynthesis protein n=1 Tax=Mammaliicoccus sciuri TaxID=1296 RepID=A0AAI8DGR8_MAMSC|nr:PhzF family phenazine biosynthesis protein [Mammaliicoccus sciuri]ASE34812.1 PhzF family phenazine biosynthesis protein [Mammaliicoccus sciuri]MCD8777170.1 PhzF family phenazine biosynthesis protein [Mammaliicoccus sciuri]MCD8780556.1 PhzF family phenazine biosynthesis protein [Mammaliicoccus sciuri]MCD8800627.1 PhzF family phenazine biosynthesis protein [Mammaliicoccus sciuri]MCD8860643.1 PhzF family phenazine biosynthesis protein [Mammaliicoccus sciuri]
MKQLGFKQVDVFANGPFKGNPVAVIFDADDLTDEQMKDIASWTNLSETTFVCKPEDEQADYKLRIFTPNNELSFAGHPTIGSSYAVLQNGLISKNKGYLVQECGVGLVKIDYTEEKTYFSLPKPKISDIELKQLDGIIDSLGINGEDVIHSKKVNIGAEWLTLHIKNSSIVKRIEPNFEQMKNYIYEGTTGVTIFGENEDDKDTTFEVRSFAPNEGVNEDPVCGSGNGCVAAVNELYGLIVNKEYSNSQGECINRNGRVYIKQEDGLKLGGISKIVIDGKIRIEN